MAPLLTRLVALLLLLGPGVGRAEAHLLDAALAGPGSGPASGTGRLDLAVPGTLRLAAAPRDGGPATAPAAGSLDFDLLAPPPPPSGPDPTVLARRRTLLTWHQGTGIGLFVLTLGTAVVGQLNYNDRFAGSRPSRGTWMAPHAVLAGGTLLAFAGTGALALFAPAPVKRQGFDRITLHQLAMFTAGAGMAAEGALGLYTQRREGYLNQPSYARAHLVLGYVVLAAVTTGVGALIF